MKFLIVEDDPIALNVLTHILNDFGYVEIARDGREGINTFRKAASNKSTFDAVFLDIMMPHVDGHEVLEAIRSFEKEAKIEGSAGTKIIMCSALDDSKNVIKAFRNQCEGYLTKPVHKQDVEEQLRKLSLLSE
ncbi:MAG: response regulator [Fibrobacterales bacterium]